MLRLLLPMLIGAGAIFVLVMALSSLIRLARRRRLGRRDDKLVERTRQRHQRDAHALREARISLLRARELRVTEQIAALLGEPDIDLLPARQVAGLLVAVEDLGDASRLLEDDTDPRSATPSAEAGWAAYDVVLVHAETAADGADRDLRAARLAKEDGSTEPG